MSDQGNLRVGVELDTSPAQAGLQKLYNVMRSGAKQAAKANEPLDRSFDQIILDAKKLGVQWDATSKRFRKNGRFVTLDNLKKQLNELEGEFDDVGKQADEMFGGLTAGFKGVFQGIPQGIGQSIGMSLLEPFKKLPGALAGTVTTFAEIERSIRATLAIAGDTGSFDKLSESLNKLAAATKFTTAELAEASVQLARAGFSVAEVEAALPGIAMGAAATGESMESMSDTVIAALGGFGIGVAETSATVDILVAAANNANTSVTELGEGLKYVGPVAAELGFEFSDVAATAGLLANAGIKASQMGTTLRGGLQRLAAAAAGTDAPMGDLSRGTANQAAVMERLGISLTDTEGKMKPLPGVILELKEGFDKLEGVDRNQAAKILFGDEAGTGFLQLLNTSTEELEDFVGKTANAAGSAQAASEQMLSGISGALDLLDSAFGSFVAAVGKMGAELFEPLIRGITDVLNVFNNLDPTVQKFVVGLGLVAGATAAAMAAAKAYTIALAAQNALLIAAGQSALPGLGAQLSSLASGAMAAVTKATAGFNAVMTANIAVSGSSLKSLSAIGPALTKVGAGFGAAAAGAKAFVVAAAPLALTAAAIGSIVAVFDTYNSIVGEANQITAQVDASLINMGRAAEVSGKSLDSIKWERSVANVGLLQAGLDRLREFFNLTTVETAKSQANTDAYVRSTEKLISGVNQSIVELEQQAASMGSGSAEAAAYAEAQESVLTGINGLLGSLQSQKQALEALQAEYGTLTVAQQQELDTLNNLINALSRKRDQVEGVTVAVQGATQTTKTYTAALIDEKDKLEETTEALKKKAEARAKDYASAKENLSGLQNSIPYFQRQITQLEQSGRLYGENATATAAANAELKSYTQSLQAEVTANESVIQQLRKRVARGEELTAAERNQLAAAKENQSVLAKLAQRYQDLGKQASDYSKKLGDVTTATNEFVEAQEREFQLRNQQTEFTDGVDEVSKIRDRIEATDELTTSLITKRDALIEERRALEEKSNTQEGLTKTELDNLKNIDDSIIKLGERISTLKEENEEKREGIVQTQKGTEAEIKQSIQVNKGTMAWIARKLAKGEATRQDIELFNQLVRTNAELRNESKALENARKKQEDVNEAKRQEQAVRDAAGTAQEKNITSAEDENTKLNVLTVTVNNLTASSKALAKAKADQATAQSVAAAAAANEYEEQQRLLSVYNEERVNLPILSGEINRLAEAHANAAAQYGEGSKQAADLKVQLEAKKTALSETITALEANAESMKGNTNQGGYLAEQLQGLANSGKSLTIQLEAEDDARREAMSVQDERANKLRNEASAANEAAAANERLTNALNNAREAQGSQRSDQSNALFEITQSLDAQVGSTDALTSATNNATDAKNALATIERDIQSLQKDGLDIPRELSARYDQAVMDATGALQQLQAARSVDAQSQVAEAQASAGGQEAAISSVTTAYDTNSQKVQAISSTTSDKLVSNFNEVGEAQRRVLSVPYTNSSTVKGLQQVSNLLPSIREGLDAIADGQQPARDIMQQAASATEKQNELMREQAEQANRIREAEAARDNARISSFARQLQNQETLYGINERQSEQLTRISGLESGLADARARALEERKGQEAQFFDTLQGLTQDAQKADDKAARMAINNIRLQSQMVKVGHTEALNLLGIRVKEGDKAAQAELENLDKVFDREEQRAELFAQKASDRLRDIKLEAKAERNKSIQAIAGIQQRIQATQNLVQAENDYISELDTQISFVDRITQDQIDKVAQVRDARIEAIDATEAKQEQASNEAIKQLEAQKNKAKQTADARIKKLDEELAQVKAISDARIDGLNSATPAEAKLARIREQELKARAQDASLSERERLEAQAQIERAARQKQIKKEQEKIARKEAEAAEKRKAQTEATAQFDARISELRQEQKSDQEKFDGDRQAAEDAYEKQVDRFNKKNAKQLEKINSLREKSVEKLIDMEGRLFDLTVNREEARGQLAAITDKEKSDLESLANSIREQEKIDADRFKNNLKNIDAKGKREKDVIDEAISKVDEQIAKENELADVRIANQERVENAKPSTSSITSASTSGGSSTGGNISSSASPRSTAGPSSGVSASMSSNPSSAADEAGQVLRVSRALLPVKKEIVRLEKSQAELLAEQEKRLESQRKIQEQNDQSRAESLGETIKNTEELIKLGEAQIDSAARVSDIEGGLADARIRAIEERVSQEAAYFDDVLRYTEDAKAADYSATQESLKNLMKISAFEQSGFDEAMSLLEKKSQAGDKAAADEMKNLRTLQDIEDYRINRQISAVSRGISETKARFKLERKGLTDSIAGIEAQAVATRNLLADEKDYIGQLDEQIAFVNRITDEQIERVESTRDAQLDALQREEDKQKRVSDERIQQLERAKSKAEEASKKRVAALNEELEKAREISEARIEGLNQLTPAERELETIRKNELRAKSQDLSLSRQERLEAQAALEREARQSQIKKEQEKLARKEAKAEEDRKKESESIRTIDQDITAEREKQKNIQEEFAGKREAIESGFQKKIDGFNKKNERQLAKVNKLRENAYKKQVRFEQRLFDLTVSREEARTKLSNLSEKEQRAVEAMAESLRERAELEGESFKNNIDNIEALEAADRARLDEVIGMIDRSIKANDEATKNQLDNIDEAKQAELDAISEVNSARTSSTSTSTSASSSTSAPTGSSTGSSSGGGVSILQTTSIEDRRTKALRDQLPLIAENKRLARQAADEKIAQIKAERKEREGTADLAEQLQDQMRNFFDEEIDMKNFILSKTLTDVRKVESASRDLGKTVENIILEEALTRDGATKENLEGLARVAAQQSMNSRQELINIEKEAIEVDRLIEDKYRRIVELAREQGTMAQQRINELNIQKEQEEEIKGSIEERISGIEFIRDEQIAAAEQVRDRTISAIDAEISKRAFFHNQRISYLEAETAREKEASDQRLAQLDLELFRVQAVSNERISALRELTPSEEKLAGLREKELRARARDSSLSREERLQAKAQLERAERNKQIAEEQKRIDEVQEKIAKEKATQKEKELVANAEIAKLQGKVNTIEAQYAAQRSQTESAYQAKVSRFNAVYESQVQRIAKYREESVLRLIALEKQLFNEAVTREQARSSGNQAVEDAARQREALADRVALEAQAARDRALANAEALKRQLQDEGLLKEASQDRLNDALDLTERVATDVKRYSRTEKEEIVERGRIQQQIADDRMRYEREYHKVFMANERQRKAALSNNPLFRPRAIQPSSRFAGGPVEGGSNYTVNELGREAFLSKDGMLSMINAPAFGKWRPSTDGTVIPAHIASELALPRHQSVDLSKAPGVSSMASQNASRAPSGNSLDRVARALLKGLGGDKVTNNVTIQSDSPVTAASDMLVSLTRLRRKNR